MAKYQIFKETALPGALQPHSIYLVAPAARPDYIEMYVTGASETTVKRIIDQDDVQAMITAQLAGSATMEFVADITARNALTPTNGMTVFVKDATGDATVGSGAAAYIYEAATTTWIKTYEYESLDVGLTWAALTGKPTSAVADIDDAVAKRHNHANKTELDKVGEDGDGDLTYNGASPRISWTSASW